MMMRKTTVFHEEIQLFSGGKKNQNIRTQKHCCWWQLLWKALLLYLLETEALLHEWPQEAAAISAHWTSTSPDSGVRLPLLLFIAWAGCGKEQPAILSVLERRINSKQKGRGRNGMLSSLLFNFTSFHYSLTLWPKIWVWSQVTQFMFLVHWWTGHLSFVPVFHLLLKRFSKAMDGCWGD